MPKIAVYIQPGMVAAERQLRLCIEFCESHHYQLTSICPAHDPASAVTLAVRGAVVAVLVAFAARSRPGDIRELAVASGVELLYVRPPVMSRVEALDVAGMYQRSGGDVALVARLLGESTAEIRRVLARVGVQRMKPPLTHRRQGRQNRG